MGSLGLVSAPDLPDGFSEHWSGLAIPGELSSAPRDPVPYTATYLTYAELMGREPLTEEEIIQRLELLSVADCIAAIADISTRLYESTSDPGAALTVQEALIRQTVGDAELGQALTATLSSGRWKAVFFEQQLVHLARLALLHADDRPHDDFAGGRRYSEWITCLIGVCDLLDATLKVEDHDERLAWELRQSQLNHHEDALPTIGLHYEIYQVLWPAQTSNEHSAAAEAFRQTTSITIEDYFAVGTAVFSRLLARVRDNSLPGVEPAKYFSKSLLAPRVWEAFFAQTSRRPADLRSELLAEDQQYGPTTYGSLTFERFPLVEAEPGIYMPVSMYSFQRRLTQGVFHILSEAAVAHGLDRRHYASAFGIPFQQSVEATFHRALPAESLVCDVAYGPRTHRRHSSDVILTDALNPVFVEVVSGPLQASTSTRGDLAAFESDLRRLVLEKSKQLDRCINDFFDGSLDLGIDRDLVSHAWPVLLTSHTIPHAPTITPFIETAVRSAGYLTGPRVGGLAIVSAEDLFFCEAFMEQGKSFLALTRGWKTGSKSDYPFRNHLIAEGGGRAPGSDHFERRFAEWSARSAQRLVGSMLTADDVLRDARDPQRGVDHDQGPTKEPPSE